MSAAFVLDCSLAMTWLFPDEATSQTAEVLNRLSSQTALVPSWWFIEVVNVIAIAERKGRIKPAQSTAFIANLGLLDIEQDDTGPNRVFMHLLPLCRAHKLTCYDAIYLDLAAQRRLPLATLDVQLGKAAKSLGIKVLGL